MCDNVSSESLLKPGVVMKPSVCPSAVPTLLLHIYSIVADSVKTLVSYDDLNFHVKIKAPPATSPHKAPPATSPHIATPNPHGYVLKVLNSLDSKNVPLIEGQNSMMIFLSERGYNCTVPQKTLQGEYLTVQQFPNDNNENIGKSHIVRLLTYVPGTILHSVPLTSTLCREVGSYLARLQLELKGFISAAIARRQFIWMMSQTPKVRQFVHAITQPGRLKLVTAALDNWEREVLPVLDRLPRGFIHGDFNEQNILVRLCEDTEQQGQPSYTVHGVIDFGDVSEDCYVFDLAITVMSMLTMLDYSTGAHRPDVDTHIIAGYQSCRPLDELEWDVIYECVCARLCTSLTMGAYTYLQDPGNEYLLTSALNGWAALEALLCDGKENTLRRWRTDA